MRHRIHSGARPSGSDVTEVLELGAEVIEDADSGFTRVAPILN